MTYLELIRSSGSTHFIYVTPLQLHPEETSVTECSPNSHSSFCLVVEITQD